ELLAHPLHAALWATKFCDITGANVDQMDGPPDLRARRAKMWHDWFRKRVKENVPYDRIVHGVLCATTRNGRDVADWVREEEALGAAVAKGFETDYADRPGLDLFWRRTGPDGSFTLEQVAEHTAAAFLGVRLECAQCHKHPFDRWTQADYRAYANLFVPVAVGVSPEAKKAIDAENAERNTQKGNTKQPTLGLVRELSISTSGKQRG